MYIVYAYIYIYIYTYIHIYIYVLYNFCVYIYTYNMCILQVYVYIYICKVNIVVTKILRPHYPGSVSPTAFIYGVFQGFLIHGAGSMSSSPA